MAVKKMKVWKRAKEAKAMAALPLQSTATEKPE